MTYVHKFSHTCIPHHSNVSSMPTCHLGFAEAVHVECWASAKFHLTHSCDEPIIIYALLFQRFDHNLFFFFWEIGISKNTNRSLQNVYGITSEVFNISSFQDMY